MWCRGDRQIDWLECNKQLYKHTDWELLLSWLTTNPKMYTTTSHGKATKPHEQSTGIDTTGMVVYLLLPYLLSSPLPQQETHRAFFICLMMYGTLLVVMAMSSCHRAKMTTHEFDILIPVMSFILSSHIVVLSCNATLVPICRQNDRSSHNFYTTVLKISMTDITFTSNLPLLGNKRVPMNWCNKSKWFTEDH